MTLLHPKTYPGVLILATVILSATWWLARVIVTANRRGLRDIPGPGLAKYSNFYRMKLVTSGQAHEMYREMHRKYGPVVRSAPNVVDISNPQMIPVIYGIASHFVKSNFYTTLATHLDYVSMDSLFTVREPERHRGLKRQVAQKFSMSSIKTLEPLVDPCSQLFMDSMLDLTNQRVDLGVWLQWYAFDVIGAITFNKRFGFMEARKDVNNVIEGIEFGLWYAGIIGRIPWLHPLLLGNMPLLKLRGKLMPTAPDPIRTVTDMVNESLQEYDHRRKEQDGTQQDFLSFLRQQEKSSGEQMPHRDMMNHLTNNLLAGSDTTAISLRAVFYHVIRNPAVYAKLQKEIDDADRAGRLSQYVTYAESLELEYLCASKRPCECIPASAILWRESYQRNGVNVGAHNLPAGTIVSMNAAVVHRNEQIFGADANIYRPERWTLDGASGDLKEMDRSLLTFGAGTRTCIGKNISIMEMGKFVPQILRHFDVLWDADEPEWRSRPTGSQNRPDCT